MTSVTIKDLSLNFGQVNVLKDLDLDVSDGEFLVLLGASGCGKSTLLNCIAGLLEASSGQIFIDGRNVTWEEPSHRGIGMVFQSYALYPQMSVKGNLSFGLKNAGMPKAEIENRVARAAKILRIETLLHRRPVALSGGQRQRVAIGRALVRDVGVFLFDEPLSNLDAKLRSDLRVEIKRLHHQLKNTMIYVTHDQIEAMTLADRIAVMKSGAIQQLGTPHEIYNKPKNKYVANFIGSPSMNFFEGELTENGKMFTVGSIKFPLSEYGFIGSNPIAQKAWLGIRPEHVLTGEMVKTTEITHEVIVDMVEPMGADTLVWSTLGGNIFSFRMDGQASVAKDEKLTIGLNLECATLFDVESEESL